MPFLNYHHLRYFRAIAQEGNLTRAAGHLRISPSALSTQLAQLEESLGQRLFDRSNKRLLLTEAGHIALDYAETIFRTGEELYDTLKHRVPKQRQVLRIGAVTTLSRNFQLELVRPLLNRSDIELVLRTGALRDLLRSVFAIPDDVLDKTVPHAGEQSITPLLLKAEMSQEEIITLLSRAKDFPGVGMVKSAYREYIDGLLFSQVIGYEGKIDEQAVADHQGEGYLPTDFIGKQGIEASYEAELKGEHGYDRVEVDSLGRPQKTLGAIPATPGSDILLNIDADLQKKISDSLQALLDAKHLTKGAAVAID